MMYTRMFRMIAALTALVIGLGAFLPKAQAQGFPAKPVKLVIAFAPGTGGDLLTRLVAQQLTKLWGMGVVVENRPGASGAVGTKAVIDSPADGYTLLLGSNATLIVNPALNPSVPFKAETDLVPMGMVARTKMMMVTVEGPDAPKSVASLIAMIKAKPVSFASTGAGTLGRLTSEVFLQQVGGKATHVPYKGSNESLTAVIRGDVLFASDSATAALPHIKAGRLRGLAVAGNERLEALPDLPTFAEEGVPGVDVWVWYGILAPAKTPPALVSRVAADLEKVVADKQVAGRLKDLQFEPFYVADKGFRDFFVKEQAFWRQFVQATGLKIE